MQRQLVIKNEFELYLTKYKNFSNIICVSPKCAFFEHTQLSHDYGNDISIIITIIIIIVIIYRLLFFVFLLCIAKSIFLPS